MKNLYVSAVGEKGKIYLEKIIEKFGHRDFDYYIFVYDGADLNKEIFKNCKIVYKKGLKWQLIKNNIDPKLYEKYDYIFTWDDDIDIKHFSYRNFIKILKRNKIEVAQPALSKESYFNHKITLTNNKYKYGRFTDFVEVMVPVFQRRTWLKFIEMLKKDYNGWGWGYDVLLKSYCGCKNMGIIDCENVIHTRLPQSGKTSAKNDYSNLLKEYSKYDKSKFMTLKKIN